jgi:F-type H+-transporting ATPase subunit b
MDISISAVIAQIINFAIIFFLFSKFAAKPLANAIEERRELLQKLKHADEAFHQKIQEAEKKSEGIVAEANTTKESIINEAALLASKKQKEMINEAENKANSIIKDAEHRANALQDDLQKDFEKALKETSLLVVKKLIDSDKEIESKYIEAVIKDLQ